MLGIIAVILSVIALVKISSLELKVDKFLNNKEEIKKVDNNLSTTENYSGSDTGVAEVSSIKPGNNQEVHNSNDPLVKFGNWIKDDWLLKVGVLLLIAGFGWFVSYAFVHGWIGPMGRILLGILLGIVVTIFGDFRIKKYSTQGGAFLILGCSIIVLSIFAARYVYQFFTPVVALSAIFIISSYITLTALRYDNKNLAVLGLILASVAPMFTNPVVSDPVGRFLYITVVSLATIWVTFQKNWRDLLAVASVSVLGYSLYYGYFSVARSIDALLVIAFGLSFIFFVFGISSITKFKDKVSGADVFLSIINGILIIFWTLSHVAQELQSLTIAGWMIVFAIGSFYVFSKLRDTQYFYIQSFITVTFLFIATAMELQGDALVFAYIFESAIVSLMFYAITYSQSVGHKLSLLMIGPGIMALNSIDDPSWRNSVLHQDFAILLSVSLVLLGLGWFYYKAHKMDNEDYKSGVSFHPHTLMIIFGSVYFYILVWLSTQALYVDSIAVMISLAFYTIIGIITYFFGKLNDRQVYGKYGATLLLLVLVRLVLVDVWQMELEIRIATFVIIGLLFVSTSFIGKKDKKLLNNY
jgi:uncharacterized membrane protein